LGGANHANACIDGYLIYTSVLYTSMFTRLTRKGLDICTLPADVRDSCFRGGAGARGGKPPVAQMPSDSDLRLIVTRSSAIAEGPRDASCQLKSCQLPRNSAGTTYTTSPDQMDGMKLEI